MTIENEEQLERLREIGLIVARVRDAMGAALEAGMTTKELDDLGRALLEKEGARSAPEITYDFPGATCISIFPNIAHGIPGDEKMQVGDLINIDVSAEKNGFFGDTGASFVLGEPNAKQARLMRDGKRAMWAGINQVRADAPMREIGRAIQSFADKNRYTLIRNLASHGVGASLHEDPESLPTWYEPSEKRRIREGLVFTIEPFLSMGSEWAVEGGDEWTLRADTGKATVQYEHTMVATKNGAIVLTMGD